MVVCGLLGNEWYLIHTQKKLKYIKESQHDEDSKIREIKKIGGTSILAPFLGITSFFIILFAVFYIFDLIRGNYL
jgi:hypothetical protein